MTISRREFLVQSGCALSALAVPTIVPASVFSANAPSNRINVGFIGTGRQTFGANMRQMMAVPGVQAVAVCDVDSWRMGEARGFVNTFYARRDNLPTYNGCRTNADFREIIADPGIDALMIGTPDHWHVPMCPLRTSSAAWFCDRSERSSLSLRAVTPESATAPASIRPCRTLRLMGFSRAKCFFALAAAIPIGTCQ
jgi:hypothetical protein